MAQLMSIKKNVDVQPGVGVPAIFHCSQGDKGTRIILGLLNNNDSYTIPEGTTAIIRGSRADGTLFTEITADIDTTTEIKFNLTEDMTSVPGPVECEAVMTSGSANVIGTTNFIIDVEKSPASIGSVFPGTDAATTWLIDKLENEPLNSLNGESVVDAINDSTGSGLTEDVKVALLACFEKVAWIDEDGQDYYDALYNALYPPTDLSYISAVYTQSGSVYPSMSLNSLKTDLVVTAHFDNGTTEPIVDYSLSGSLVEGTRTITVTYYYKTTTFTVIVSAEPYTITNILTNCSNSNTATLIDRGESYTGTITAASGCYLDDSYITVLMGGEDVTATVLNNRVITISEVTGNIVISADAATALYPLKNGTHTFSNGCTITVSNGNHVEITSSHASGGSGLINFSDVTENTETEQIINNVQNGAKKFTINAGQTALYTIYNYHSNRQNSFNVYGLGTSGSLDIAIPDLTSTTGSNTKTFTESADVGCLFIAITQFNASPISFDVSFVVDGVQYV